MFPLSPHTPTPSPLNPHPPLSHPFPIVNLVQVLPQSLRHNLVSPGALIWVSPKVTPAQALESEALGRTWLCLCRILDRTDYLWKLWMSHGLEQNNTPCPLGLWGWNIIKSFSEHPAPTKYSRSDRCSCYPHLAVPQPPIHRLSRPSGTSARVQWGSSQGTFLQVLAPGHNELLWFLNAQPGKWHLPGAFLPPSASECWTSYRNRSKSRHNPTWLVAWDVSVSVASAFVRT